MKKINLVTLLLSDQLMEMFHDDVHLKVSTLCWLGSHEYTAYIRKDNTWSHEDNLSPNIVYWCGFGKCKGNRQ